MIKFPFISPRVRIVRRIIAERALEFLPFDERFEVLESYSVYEPFARVFIVRIPWEGGLISYYVDEYKLSEGEKDAYDRLVDLVTEELKVYSFSDDLRGHVFSEIKRIVDRYRGSLKLSGASRDRVLYYVERDLLGYGPIHVLMLDPNVEDVSCVGVNKPIYVWHRYYESIPTNIIFRDVKVLNEFILKLAHRAGKHISLAYPTLDTMLPEKHRLAATFGSEVSTAGPTFTIRKFRAKPFSPIELIADNVISDLMAAYIWLMLDYGRTIMISGGTGAGKTTLLNALSLFIRPGLKIVTVEDTPELNLPHENWIQLTVRPTYTVGITLTEIKLFDLIKLSLRYRPDYLIVGEIRGEEAFVLFQAMATGHGGISTIHAESLDYAVKRITSPPMNIPETYVKLLNIFMHIDRVTIGERVRVERRVRIIQEVEDYGEYRVISRWDPIRDEHIFTLENSWLLQEISRMSGRSIGELKEDIERRRAVLRWLMMKGVYDFTEVSKWIFRYHYNPEEVYKEAVKELGIRKIV
ncbi:MAG: type II/IV secretion system ATPase subunit [Candidatus Methanomethylicia archaeon]|nr:type II/IV secretion system ATPase subunit [Candidatus Methanomethylicia archaeon]